METIYIHVQRKKKSYLPVDGPGISSKSMGNNVIRSCNVIVASRGINGDGGGRPAWDTSPLTVSHPVDEHCSCWCCGTELSFAVRGDNVEGPLSSSSFVRST